MRSTVSIRTAFTLRRDLILLCVTFLLLTDCRAQTEFSTQPSKNRGAARQMYGSGSLRQTGSIPIITSEESTPITKEEEEEIDTILGEDEKFKNNYDHGRHDADSETFSYGTYDVYGATGRQKPHSSPSDLYGHPSLPKSDDDLIDVPSYRNGVPVNTGRPQYNLGKSHNQGMPNSNGAFGPVFEGYDEFVKSRMRTDLVSEHGIEQHGEPGDRFDAEHKTLLHELEEESEDRIEAPTTCGSTCTNDQFLCISTCTCIILDNRCDGNVDCVNADDEVNCEDYHVNETCSIKRSIRCPNSGKCIAKEWLCDGDNDCGDYSDESHCGPAKNCTAENHQFECRNGLCLPQNWVCDGENDCKDFSDEENCSKKQVCFDTDFMCSDGTCIWDYLRCNGQKDCVDGSDEMRCEVVDIHCKENQFQCAYQKCISMRYRCDGDDDCGDESDEENCPTTGESSCATNEFKCSNGGCISKKWVCDKEIDCKNGDDEHDCKYPAPRNCRSKEEFACPNGLCIPRSWMCDGVLDCSNGEDEQGCQLSCELTQYQCRTPVSNDTKPVYPAAQWLILARDHLPNCINMKRVCDGTPDCIEKDDEENCPKKVKCTKNDKCSHYCIETSDNKRSCACNSGYILGKDNVTCQDINECEFEKNPVCSQVCKNTKGSFTCECTKGYVLRPDLRTCKALGANPTLILANRVDIRELSISGPKYRSIFKGLKNAIALDYHYKRKLIFWSDVDMDVIRKVYVNGTGNEDVVRWGLESPGGIAIDWIHDLLFWTDSGTRRVEVITLDTNIRHVLVSNDLDKPRAISVHPHYGYVYWTDWGPNPKIERANMDGSERTALITEAVFWPNGLTIDYTMDRIYWTDAKHHVIESANIHGNDRKKIVTRGLHHPFAITVFEDSIFWSDWHLKSVSLANKNNGLGFKPIHSGFLFPMDLHSYHPQRQPEYINHCGDNNGKCSHMCLPNSMGYSCVCPVGSKIKKDGKTCATNADNLLIFSRKKDLRFISLDQSVKAFDTVIPVDNIESAVALTWSSDDDTIYWTDVKAHTISKANLDGTNQQDVVSHNLESPAGLAMDWITKKLYWTDAGTNRIECSNLNDSRRTLLIYEGLEKPRDIVVDPISRYMYWSDWGSHSKIEKASMDGTQRRDLITEKLVWPNGLAIDYEKSRLYWADGGTSKIEYSDFNGGRRTTLITRPDVMHPFSLEVYQNKIYWTDWKTSSIHRADKDISKNLKSSITAIRSNIQTLMDVRVFHRNRPIVENPCSNNNGNCSHLCLLTATPKLYTCACSTGLVLAPDGKTCPDMPTKFLLLSRRIDIRVLSLDTNYTVDTVIPINDLYNVSGSDVDLQTGYIYYTDPGLRFKLITRVSYKQQKKEIVIDDSIGTVDSLVVDSTGRKLYWTDAGLNSIEVSELNGTNRKVLIWSGLGNPRAIAIYYRAGLLFWSDWGHNARIERADLDGEHRMALITEGLTWPNGLAVDTIKGRIYWNDAKKKTIESADLYGLNRKVIIEKLEHPYGLAIVGDSIYWSDWLKKSLLKANKTDGTNKKTVIENLEGIMDLRFIDKRKTKSKNVCEKNNGGCSHLCLRNPTGFSCACPIGININEDKKTCNNTPTNFLLLASKKRLIGKKLIRISLDTPEMWEVTLPVQIFYHPFSIDFHWEKQYIFYTDVDDNEIRRINMRNFNEHVPIISVLNNSIPFCLAVDWVADNIYWTNMKQRLIEVARLDGSSRKILIENLKDPGSLALFPKEGYIYWTEGGEHPKIERAYLDGSNKKTIVATDLGLPNGLSIDYTSRKLYWADLLKHRIEVSDLHGIYRIALVPEANDAFGLTQYGNTIYWGDWVKATIEKADKRTGQNRNRIRTDVDEITDIKAISAERQTGWNPCAMENGGCTHLCFFTRKNYTCACPDKPTSTPCSTVPRKQMPLRKPGTENDPNYDLIDDKIDEEDISSTSRTGVGNRNRDGKLNDYNRANGETISLRTMITTTVILLVITLGIIIVIIYLQCPRKNKRDENLFNNRRNVLTFSNPNYNASAGAELPTPTSQPSQDKKGFIWKRLKYDKSQERVYEENGQAPSPEVMSLIPPSATPSSSRAASITPMESSPPAVTRVSIQRLEPSILGGSNAPKHRPIV